MRLENKRLERYLDEMSWSVESKLGPEYWIGAHNADPDQGPSYCYECALRVVAAENADNPAGEYFVDGGWGWEGDYLPTCEECGEMLESGGLTESGIEENLEHFEMYGFDPSDAFSCYEFVITYESILYDGGDADRKALRILDRVVADHFWLLPADVLEDLRYMWG